VSTITGLYRMK